MWFYFIPLSLLKTDLSPFFDWPQYNHGGEINAKEFSAHILHIH